MAIVAGWLTALLRAVTVINLGKQSNHLSLSCVCAREFWFMLLQKVGLHFFVPHPDDCLLKSGGTISLPVFTIIFRRVAILLLY